MQESNLNTLVLTDEEVRLARSQVEQIAYFKWIDAGRPDGSDLRFWLDAELEWVSYRYVPHRYVNGERAEKRLAPH